MFRTSNARRSASRRRRLTLEPLENRRVLSTIVWTNRGGQDDFDSFGASFGLNADRARAVVDAAIDSWEAVIQDFNYAHVGERGYAPLANSFNLNLSAANLNVDLDSAGLRGVSYVTGIDGDGKPYRSSITLDDNAAGNGWYFDSTPSDHAEFTDLVTRYSANKPGSDYDLYRTTVHEIGHAMGIASNADLAIWDFLELAGVDQQENDEDVYLLAAGATTATLTTEGGLHVYEGPPPNAGDPVNPDDLMNPGRDVPLDPINRRLISDLDAKILRDVYLYRVTLPSMSETFLANFNATTGALTISGEPDTDGAGPDTAHDTFIISREGLNLSVSWNGVVDTFALARLTSIVVNAGAGDDSIYVRSTPAGVPMSVNGQAGNDTIRVGSAANSLDDMLGPLTVSGGTGVNVLRVNDQGDATANTYSVTSTGVTRNGGISISYATVESLVLNCGTAADTIDVRGTAAATRLTVNCGSGDDIVNLGSAANSLDALLGAVTINGQGGLGDAININDQGDATANTYSVTSTGVTRNGGISISYATVESLVLNCGTASDTVNVRSTSNKTPVTVNGGNGNDAFNVGSAANSLDQILGPLTINGGGGNGDAIQIHDQGDATANTYDVTSTRVTRNGGVSISYAGVEGLTLACGTASDTVNVTSTARTTPVRIEGGLGLDLFQVGPGIHNVTTVQ